MPVAGRKPKPGAINRNKPTHEWTEVEDRPFLDGPDLPDHPNPRADSEEGTDEGWHPMTLEWWEDVRTMPHARLWTRSDWRFAFDTAIVADRFYSGDIKAATELRNREKVLGTTADYRRDLRIRYVAPVEERQTTTEETHGNVRYLDL